jgi:hypothetical protein
MATATTTTTAAAAEVVRAASKGARCRPASMVRKAIRLEKSHPS